MTWEYAKKIPYEGGFTETGDWILRDDLPGSDVKYFVVEHCEVIRHTNSKEEHLVYYPDGTMERRVVYNVFPQVNTDGIPLMSPYGYKMKENILKKKGLL